MKEIGSGNDLEQHGYRVNPFDYSEKTIITVSECKDMIQNEIARVKMMQRKTKKWVHDPRPDGALYLNDPVTRISKIGPAVGRKLNANGIETVGDLIGLDKKDMQIIARRTAGLSIKSLENFVWNCCADLLDGDVPKVKYYLDADNPYAAKFGTTVDMWGEEHWRNEIKKTTAFSGVVCISALVKHIVIETKKFYAGTEF